MPKLHLVKATTSKLTHVWVPDSSSTIGAGLTGLAFNTASLTGYYYREGAGSAVQITLASSTLGTFTSGAFKEVSSANMPGLYEVGIPDAALATGANSVIVLYKGAANMVPVVLEIQLTDANLHDATRLGLSALPNAAAAASGGLATVDGSNAVKVQSGTGANQISLASGLVTVGTNNDKTGYALTTLESTVLQSGTAQAGAAGSITLAAGASATTDLYVGEVVKVYGGTGAGQARIITAYNGTTKVATVSRSWATNPDNTSTYAVLAASNPKLDASLQVTVGALATDTVNAAALATDAVTEIQSGLATASALSTVQADTDDIQSRLPAALVSGRIDASVGAMAANTLTATAIAADAITAAKVADGTIDAATFAAGAINAAAIATDAITAAKIAADAIGASELAADAVTEIQAAVAAGAVASVTGSVGSVATGGITAASFAAGAIDAAAIATDAIGSAELAASAVTEIQSGLATSAALTTAQADLDDIQTRLPAALVSGRIDASVGAMAAGTVTAAAIATDAIDADALADGAITAATFAAGAIDATAIASDAITAGKIAADAIGASELSNTAVIEIASGVWDEARASHVAAGSFGQRNQVIRDGTAQAGAGSSITLDAGASATNSFYNNTLLTIIGGTGAGQSRYITAYVGATKVATVSAWTTAPDNTSVFVILPGDAIPGATAPTAAQNAAAVWDEARSSHTTSGTFGQGVASVQGNLTGSAASVTGNVGGSVGSVAAGGITAASFAAGAIDNAAIATDAIGAAEIAAAATTEIASAVWDEARSAHTAAGSFGRALQLVRDGTAQAGSSTTITLDAGASAINDFYANTLIDIIAGTGAGQSRFISSYVGASKVATVGAVWSTTPDATSVFSIETFGAIPGATAPTSAQNAAAVWDELRASHVASGSFGQGVASVQGNVTGSAASVTGAVGSVTGAVGSVIGAVGSVAGNVVGSVGSLAAQAKADVNAEVLDVLATDTFAEPSAVPAATSSLKDMIHWLFTLGRNKQTQTSSTTALRNDGDTATIATATDTDDATTASIGKWS